jgi:mitochondrial enoyl-[acyl-carrier protein] reductase / trans-2-enoyl-CoA reductase
LLSNLGGDINITDDYLSSPGFQEILKDIPGIKLGLNAVGGESVYDFARVLESKCAIVTYGGMSKKKINIPPELLSYKQLQLKGYWMSTWYKTHSLAERTEMMNAIFQLVRDKKFILFFESHDFDDFDYALEKSVEPFYFRKVLINVDHPDRFKEHDSIPESEFFVHEGPSY